MRRNSIILKGLVLVLFIVGMVGCETLQGVNPFNDEKEVSGVVEAVDTDANTLTVDGIEYTVTEDTEFEGLDGLSGLSTGDEVEIEYEEPNGNREAVEVERGESDDDD